MDESGKAWYSRLVQTKSQWCSCERESCASQTGGILWRLLGKNPDGCGDGLAVDALEVKAQVVRVYDVFGVGHVGLIASTTIIPLQSGVANMSRVCSVLVPSSS